MKIKVPEGMLKAACNTGFPSKVEETQAALEAALRWLAEHPIAPTMEQAHEIFMLKAGFDFDLHEWVRWGAVEWQRRMFVEPEPEVHARTGKTEGCMTDPTVSDQNREYILRMNDAANRAVEEILSTGATGRGITAQDEHSREGSTGTSTPAPATPDAVGADSRKRR